MEAVYVKAIGRSPLRFLTLHGWRRLSLGDRVYWSVPHENAGILVKMLIFMMEVCSEIMED